MTRFNNIFLAGVMLAGAPLAVVSPAAAQVVSGIAVANPDAIVVNANAYRTAETQRATTYKAQFDSAEQRRQQIAAQLQPLYEKFNSDRQAANPNQASLQQQAQQIQRIEQQGQAEIQQILEPVAKSRAYVIEQITDQLEPAIEAAKSRRKVTLVLRPDAIVSADQAYNLNQEILNELNRLIPSAQLVPPADWKPAAQREAEAAATQQQQPQPQQPGVQAEGR